LEELDVELEPDAAEVANGAPVALPDPPPTDAPPSPNEEIPPESPVLFFSEQTPTAEGRGINTGLGQQASKLEPKKDPVENALQTIIAYWHDCSLVIGQRDYARKELFPDEDEKPVQPGPCYTARGLAMVHVAMYDALAGITKEGPTYLKYGSAAPNFPSAHPCPVAPGQSEALLN
jgi:hypothetical protein